MGNRSRRWQAQQRISGGPPGRRQLGADARILAKVRALLAKAESTPFEAEAEALTAKAQELMTRYAITRAMLEHGEGAPGEPLRRHIDLDPPYVSAKAFLLSTVASANRCETVWSRQAARAVVFGFEPDLAAVEMLYTSLLIQVAQAIARAGSVRDPAGTSRTRSFRRSFLLGFTSRVGERLREATATSAEAMESEFGSSLVPVLADRKARVREAARAAFPRTVSRTFDSSNGQGFMAGRAAADRASLATGTSQFLTANRAL